MLRGEREADEILAGAAIGAAIDAGVGAYMDRQEERFAHIPGTTPERISDNTLLVHFDSDLLFDVDSFAIGPAGQDSLERVAQVLLDFPKTAVVIQGHTDSTGSESHNLELSERRANSVRSYLIARAVRRRLLREQPGQGLRPGAGRPRLPDDQAEKEGEDAGHELILIENWFEELRRLAPVG